VISLTDKPLKGKIQRKPPVQQVKLVAEMPQDEEMRENLQNMKENDGFPGSCGI
jgi:hypothetical protein